MILGVLCMLVANAAALLGAHALLRRLRSGRASADLVLFLLFHVILLSAAVLAAGLTHGLNPWALGLAGLLALGGLLAGREHLELPRWRMPAAGTAWSVLGVVLVVRLLLQVWFFAPYLGDSLGYHLPKVAEWVQAGGFAGGDLGVDVRSTFPAGFELMETWWVVFLHHDVLIEMAGVEFFLLAVASVYALADGMGWGARTATIAAGLFALNPAFHFQATSCMNDGPVTALLLSAAALIVSGTPLTAVLIPVALGAGVKPTLVYAVPGLAILASLFPRGDESGAKSTKTLAVLAGAALLVGSFWYLRNWAVYGNPIYPMGLTGIKSLTSGSTMQRLGPSLRSLHENVTCFLDIRIYDQILPPDPLCTAGFGWGPVGFALGSLALVPVVRSETLMRRLALGLAGSAASVFLLVELDLWNDRFVVFLAALPALALARIWDRYRFVAALGWFALVLQFLETFLPGNMPPEGLRTLLSQTWRDRSSVPAPSDAPTERLGYSADDFGLAYPLYGPSYSRRLVYLRDESADALLTHIDREALTLVYVAQTLPRREAVFEEAVRRGRLKPFVRGAWKGYRVLPPP